MQVTETLSEGLKRAYTVVVSAADIESKRAARLANLGKTLRLPGFRPGKVPPTVVRQRYGTAVTAEVLEQSVSEATQQVLTDRGLRPALQPKVDVVNLDSSGDQGSGVQGRTGIAAGDRAARFRRHQADPAEGGSGAGDGGQGAGGYRAAEPRRWRRSPQEELGERGAAKGEVLTVDYIGRIDGAEFPGGTGNDIEVEIGGGGFIPGFSEQLEGMRPERDAATIEVSFPAEYGVPTLAGKAATFEVTCQGAEPPGGAGRSTTSWRRSWASRTWPRCATRSPSASSAEYDQLSRLRLKRQLLDALADMVQFPSPEGMVEQEFSQIWQRLEADRKAGRLDDDDKDKDEETLKAEYRAIAERRVRLGLLLAEIGRVNSITVTPDEMTRAMRTEAMRYPRSGTADVRVLPAEPAARRRRCAGRCSRRR